MLWEKYKLPFMSNFSVSHSDTKKPGLAWERVKIQSKLVLCNVLNINKDL